MVLQCYHNGMATLVIKSVPKQLHEYVRKSARENRRSQNQELIIILERVFFGEKVEKTSFSKSLFAQRKLLPGYAMLEKKGALVPRKGDKDITDLITEDRF